MCCRYVPLKGIDTHSGYCFFKRPNNTIYSSGSFPDILDLFPSRNPPVKQGPEDFLANVASSSKQPVLGGGLASTGSGLGFFTPGQEQNGFATPGFHMPPLQPFRLGTMHNPRDSL